jgi:hypothetical protein
MGKLFTLENQIIVDGIELSAWTLMWELEFTKKRNITRICSFDIT